MGHILRFHQGGQVPLPNSQELLGCVLDLQSKRGVVGSYQTRYTLVQSSFLSRYLPSYRPMVDIAYLGLVSCSK